METDGLDITMDGVEKRTVSLSDGQTLMLLRHGDKFMVLLKGPDAVQIAVGLTAAQMINVALMIAAGLERHAVECDALSS